MDVYIIKSCEMSCTLSSASSGTCGKIFRCPEKTIKKMFEITKHAFNTIKNHAKTQSPKEACGVLGGQKTRDRITHVFKSTNTDESPFYAYTIDPRELLAIIKKIEDLKDLDHLGFYHSHPFSNPHPSSIDMDRATWDGFIYLIFSIPHDSVGCWSWNEIMGRFVEEEIIIV
jgi:proteasome lid subunit RPN8/RPN11